MSRRVVSYSDLDSPNQATLINNNQNHSHENKRQRRNPQSNHIGNGNGNQPNPNQPGPYPNGHQSNGNPNTNPNKSNKSKRGRGGRGGRGNASNGRNQNGTAQSHSNFQGQGIGNAKGKGGQIDSENQIQVQNRVNGVRGGEIAGEEVGMDYQEAEGAEENQEVAYDYDAEEDYGEEGYYDEEEDYSNADDPSLAEAGDAFLASINFFQPEEEEETSNDFNQISTSSSSSNHRSNGKSRVLGGSKPLTKSQVWDDSSLINAWDAAVEEYQQFHSKRSKWKSSSDQEEAQVGIQSEVTMGKRKAVESPLWNDSPSIHSVASTKAKEQFKENEIENRKVEKLKEAERYGKESAGKVLIGLRVGEKNSNDGSEALIPNELKESHSDDSTTSKGYSITPSLTTLNQGNKAWKEACEEISKSKPIRIGNELIPSNTESSSHVSKSSTFISSNPNESFNIVSTSSSNPTSQNQQLPPSSESQPPVPPIPLVGDENLQNMIMAWYYAGYYTGVQQGLLQAQQ